jgi:hypothetical protein
MNWLETDQKAQKEMNAMMKSESRCVSESSESETNVMSLLVISNPNMSNFGRVLVRDVARSCSTDYIEVLYYSVVLSFGLDVFQAFSL